MKKAFTIGAIAGASALVIGVPLFAQLSVAAPSSPVSATPAVTVQSSVVTATQASDKEVPDEQEKAVDPSLAKITADAAAQIALQAQPGQVHENTLDNEHGNLAYKVEITNAGKEYDVLVDAVSGKVTKNWEDRQGGPQHEQSGQDASEQPGTENPNT